MTLDTWLWIVTVLLATVLLISTSKMVVPRERIAAAGHAGEWVMDFSPASLRAIGGLEILAAAGLILPAVLHIAPVLVPITATCVALLFACAAVMRLRRGERATIAADLVYLALALFVAWGRSGPAPLA
ncbi:DoxX family protein [Actinoplanes sp. NPDC023714]|uniref:DoxX family protein n=1 Tax=Actinoplanes sp. NPDC023714 TaxID=3154322 RepID=UPI0033F312F0